MALPRLPEASQRKYGAPMHSQTLAVFVEYSFCQWLEDSRRLAASFFCSHISSACGSMSQIVPMLAYHLALYSPAYQSELCAVLEKRQNTPALDVLNQFETLMHKPMLEAKDAMPDGIVVVVNVLDECNDRSGIHLFLDVMFRFALGLPLKFFITSHPEYFVQDRMLSRAGANLSILHLHNIEQSLVEGDIKKYLNEALHSMLPPPSPWQIDSLAQRTRNLFIYAVTVVQYIHPEDFMVDSGA
ncbi:hypothetical protein FRC11_000119 [Ceratobasidium sp. 423]|nr:hypothetical protein FRC11_000119 [Ceratobasidium sp. 423]